jgi:uncharacterized protein (TIGR02118 family)
MARMVVIYKTPADVKAFERHYFETHIPLVKQIPGFRTYEISRGPVRTLAGPTDVHLVATVAFDDFAAMQRGFASPQGQAAAADRRTYAPDNSGVQMFVFDSQAV